MEQRKVKFLEEIDEEERKFMNDIKLEDLHINFFS